MSGLKRLAVGIVVLALLTAAGFVFLQHRLVRTAETLLSPPDSATTATEFHRDGTTTVYASAEERIAELRPQVHAVVEKHSGDIDRILDLRHAAPMPSADPNTPAAGINLTLFQRHADLACAEFKRGVHLPWLRDDVDELCRKVQADQDAHLRDFVYAIASSHVSRRCSAAVGTFAPDYPEDEQERLRQRWDKGALDVFVPTGAAAGDDLTAEVKTLWDDLEDDLDTLVTPKQCTAAFPDLAEPVEYNAAGEGI